jgi:hypothetical protein
MARHDARMTRHRRSGPGRANRRPPQKIVPDTFREMAHGATLRRKRCGPQQRLHRMPLHTLMAINCRRISPPQDLFCAQLLVARGAVCVGHGLQRKRRR